MDERILNIIMLLIPVLATIITNFVIPLIKTKVNEAKLQNIVKWVRYAVQCAEMIYKNETGKGLEKKEYVVDFIDRMFNSKREVITKEQISVIIESLIAELDGYTINTERVN